MLSAVVIRRGIEPRHTALAAALPTCSRFLRPDSTVYTVEVLRVGVEPTTCSVSESHSKPTELSQYMVVRPTGNQPVPQQRMKNMAAYSYALGRIPSFRILFQRTGVNNGSRTRTMTFTVSCANRYTISTKRLRALNVIVATSRASPSLPRLVLILLRDQATVESG